MTSERGSEPILRRIAKELFGESFASKIWKRIEIVGDIAIIRKPFDLEDVDKLKILGEEILRRFRYVKSVWLAVSPVETEHRVRSYVHLAGEKRSETVYREHGCSFLLDITKVYISPVLSYDHIRTARMVKPNEDVLNMFAGIGGYSIVISRHARPRYVLSIDLNPYAVHYLKKNIELNRVETFNDVILGDALTVGRGLKNFDRVLLPLPELWREASVVASEIVKNGGAIHVHIFIGGDNKSSAFSNARNVVLDHLRNELPSYSFEVVGGHVIRSVGPRRYHVVLDIIVKKSRG